MWIVDQGFTKCGSRNVDCGSRFSQMWIQKCGLWIRVFPNMDPEIWIDCGSGTSLKEQCHSANIWATDLKYPRIIQVLYEYISLQIYIRLLNYMPLCSFWIDFEKKQNPAQLQTGPNLFLLHIVYCAPRRWEQQQRHRTSNQWRRRPPKGSPTGESKQQTHFESSVRFSIRSAFEWMNKAKWLRLRETWSWPSSNPITVCHMHFCHSPWTCFFAFAPSVDGHSQGQGVPTPRP